MIHSNDTITGFEELYKTINHPDDQFFVHADLSGNINPTYIYNEYIKSKRYK